jgi:hypothetical protein
VLEELAMSDRALTRRQILEVSAAALIGAGLSGCRREKSTSAPGPPPTLGWETITSGDDGPGPRSRHKLVYDRKANAAVLFGGIFWGPPAKLRADTWELHDRQWTEIATSESPAARHRGAMVYMDNHGQSVIFGGQGYKNVIFGDTWTYSNGGWRQLTNITAPPARCGHCLAFDERAGVAVLFGGIAPGDQPLGDTWLVDGNTWKEVESAGPSLRRYAAFAYAPDLQGCLLHGGSEDDHGRRKYGDAWLFRDGAWTQLGKAFQTEPRDDHGLAYHRVAKRMVMFEGVSGKRGLLAGDATGWHPVGASPLHPRHQCSPLTWDDALGGLLMHGGEEKHQGPQFDATLLLRMPAAA